MIGTFIKKGDLVIFESTVYPGVTEEICAKIIEKKSGLIFNKDFYCGYSPERINPGDKKHSISSVIKITSGSTEKISLIVDKLYKEIVSAGTHMASSIKVAEAAKVIENTQRDVNIALINEISIIFNKLNIDTKSVLDAANTKWNFLPFKPGLVGGHCIGVDPYYLAYKSLKAGHRPDMIIAGRKINDKMAFYFAEQLKKLMMKKKINIKNSKILIMGFSFKENCPDFRNSKIPDLIKGIKKYCPRVDVYDPWVNKNQVNKEYKIKPIDEPIKGKYDAIVIAVAHNEFKSLTESQIRAYGKDNHILYDIKYLLKKNESEGRL
jgi:UDP-N-acetyl-D-galactosamine dehydrogenase